MSEANNYVLRCCGIDGLLCSCRATITLHNPYMDFNDPSSFSTSRCLSSANAILEAYYDLTKAVALSFPSNVPLTKLHPFVTVSPADAINGDGRLIVESDLLVFGCSGQDPGLQTHDKQQ